MASAAIRRLRAGTTTVKTESRLYTNEFEAGVQGAFRRLNKAAGTIRRGAGPERS
jgi:hypothetical protein